MLCFDVGIIALNLFASFDESYGKQIWILFINAIKFQVPTSGRTNTQSFELLKDKLRHIKNFKSLFEQKSV